MKSTVVDEGLSSDATRVLLQRRNYFITLRDNRMRNLHQIAIGVLDLLGFIHNVLKCGVLCLQQVPGSGILGTASHCDKSHDQCNKG